MIDDRDTICIASALGSGLEYVKCITFAIMG